MVKAGGDVCSEETFGHFVQMWFDIYKKPYLREKNQDAIRYVFNHQILPLLGNYRLQDISPMQIQALMASLAGKSNSLQSKVLIHLRSIFTVAMENGLVAKSPVSSMLKAGGKRTEEKNRIDARGKPSAPGAGHGHPGQNLPVNRPAYGDAPG